jgi:hypothetical protein
MSIQNQTLNTSINLINISSKVHMLAEALETGKFVAQQNALSFIEKTLLEYYINSSDKALPHDKKLPDPPFTLQELRLLHAALPKDNINCVVVCSLLETALSREGDSPLTNIKMPSVLRLDVSDITAFLENPELTLPEDCVIITDSRTNNALLERIPQVLPFDKATHTDLAKVFTLISKIDSPPKEIFERAGHFLFRLQLDELDSRTTLYQLEKAILSVLARSEEGIQGRSWDAFFKSSLHEVMLEQLIHAHPVPLQQAITLLHSLGKLETSRIFLESDMVKVKVFLYEYTAKLFNEYFPALQDEAFSHTRENFISRVQSLPGRVLNSILGKDILPQIAHPEEFSSHPVEKGATAWCYDQKLNNLLFSLDGSSNNVTCRILETAFDDWAQSYKDKNHLTESVYNFINTLLRIYTQRDFSRPMEQTVHNACIKFMSDQSIGKKIEGIQRKYFSNGTLYSVS